MKGKVNQLQTPQIRRLQCPRIHTPQIRLQCIVVLVMYSETLDCICMSKHVHSSIFLTGETITNIFPCTIHAYMYSNCQLVFWRLKLTRTVCFVSYALWVESAEEETYMVACMNHAGDWVPSGVNGKGALFPCTIQGIVIW